MLGRPRGRRQAYLWSEVGACTARALGSNPVGNVARGLLVLARLG